MSAVMVSMTVLIRTFSSGIHKRPVSWNCVYHLRMKLSDGGCFPNLVRNWRWTIVHRQSYWITLFLSYSRFFGFSNYVCIPDVYLGLTVFINFFFLTRWAANLTSKFEFRKLNSSVDCFCLIADVIRITDITAKNSRRPDACNATKMPDFIE